MSLAAFASAFMQSDRLLALSLAPGAGLPDNTFLPLELYGQESLSGAYTYELACLSSDAHLELKRCIGVPAQLALLTDQGQQRAICGLVTQARHEGSDGGFARYRLTLQDPFAVLARRRNSRVFQDLSVREFVARILGEHREKNPVLAECFDLDDRCIGQHPSQSWVTQYNESDTHFIQRWLTQEGIGWYFRHGEDWCPGQQPRITLVLFDDPAAFAPCSAARVRFHRADGTEAEDSITHWGGSRQLATGSVERASHEYKRVLVECQEKSVDVSQGSYGGRLASTLEDYHYDTSHAANDEKDYARYGRLRAQAHALASKTFTGQGSQRALAVGQTFELAGHPVHDQDGAEARRFALIQVECYARNNLPGEWPAPLRALCTPALAGAFAGIDAGLDEPVFRNRFSCVRKGIPLVPAFSGTAHAKPVAPSLLIGIVVGPEGEEIHTDELGRIKVRMPFTRQADHAHAQGAGATDSDRDSQWIRVVQPWSGTEYGGLFIPRVGDEVIISYVGGDIDRPIVTGTVYNGTHRPATASHAGNLPGNRKLAALKSKMYKGNGANELLWDDTTGEQRIRVASDHAATALNQGYLVHPRVGGNGEPRGEGFELRTDHYGALRAAKGLLISTDPRENAKSTHLDSRELTTQMQGALEMSQALTEVAEGHTAEALAVNAETRKLLEAARRTYSQSGGTGVQAQVPGYAEPILALSSPAGLVCSTPKTGQLVAGEHLHLSSQQDTNLAIGRKFAMAVKKAWSVFVDELEIKLFAGKGKVLIQAHDNNIEATAKRDFKIASVAGNIEISTPNALTLTGGGCQIRLAAGTIDIKAPGPVNIHGSIKNFTGPAGGNFSGALPQMPMQPGDMVLQHHYENGEPIRGASFKAILADGSIRTGVLDGAGKALLAGVPRGAAQIFYGADPMPFKGREDWLHVKDEGIQSQLEAFDPGLDPPQEDAAAPAPQGALAEAAGTLAAAGPAGAQPFATGLGEDVDKLVAKSPGLQRDLEKLDKENWAIEYGPALGGSTASRAKKLITIDGAQKGNPEAVLQSLAHEVGHATHPYQPDFSSKAKFLEGTLADEGAATLKNIQVQREIIANGGPDIGIAGNSANHAAYNGAYDQYLKDGDAAAARQTIGARFGTGERTSNTQQPYADYYGGWYDKNFSARN